MDVTKVYFLRNIRVIAWLASWCLQCDLHVHTLHSGMCTVPLLRHICRECYSAPEAVYERLKSLGMGLVTVTDHDSIEAGEVLGCHADFFLSEEVTCQMPSGTEIHIGVYDLSERQHIEIQRRRNDLSRLLSYLREQDILFSLNHAFSSLTGRRAESDWSWFESDFPALEVRNGHMLPMINSLAAELARAGGKSGFGGSDAHTLFSVGAAFTEVPEATNRAEFLQGLRLRRARVLGDQGSYVKLTRDLLWIGLSMIREKPATVSLLPLLLLIPLVSFGNYLSEWTFARRWGCYSRGRDTDISASPRPLGSEGVAI